MNNEPVAWIIDAKMTDCDDNFIWNTGNYPDWQVKDWIPLYTHPVKEQLTDEEIADMVCSGEYWELSEEQVIIAVHFDKFARAILRKVQEADKIESLGTVNIGGVHYRNGKEVK